jgi:exosortase/archaeosortase family protein
MPPWLIFLLSFAAFHALWEGVRPSGLGRAWIEGGLVPASAQVLRWVQPQWQVQAQGRKLRSPTGGVTVQRGCEGMEFVALGWAALLTAGYSRQALRRPALAWLTITAGVILLAVLRLASLMWCRVAQPESLAMWHGLLSPLLMVLGTAALCAPWLRRGRD